MQQQVPKTTLRLALEAVWIGRMLDVQEYVEHGGQVNEKGTLWRMESLALGITEEATLLHAAAGINTSHPISIFY